MACQWEDEQTGGHCPDLAQHYHRHQPQVVHVHQRRPHRLARPGHLRPLVRLPGAVRRPPGADHEPGRSSRAARRCSTSRRWACPRPTCHAARRTRSSSSRPTRARWPRSRRCPRSGCCSTTAPASSPTGQQTPGNPYPGFEQSFSRWPIPGTTARFCYFGPVGRSAPPSPRASRSTRTRRTRRRCRCTDYGPRQRVPAACGATRRSGSGTGSRTRRVPPSRTSPPTLKSNTTVVGAGAVHVWVRSSTPDVDLLRRPSARSARTATRRSCRTATCAPASASSRPPRTTSSSSGSTLLTPIPTELASDVRPLPRGRFVEVVIPLYYEGHVYRAGLADPRDDLGAERDAADLGVHDDRPEGDREGFGRSSRSRCRRA